MVCQPQMPAPTTAPIRDVLARHLDTGWRSASPAAITGQQAEPVHGDQPSAVEPVFGQAA
jgi:hypothetical protein